MKATSSFDDVAELLTAPSTDAAEDEAEQFNDQRYWRSVPDDDALFERFLKVFASGRQQFAWL